MKVNLPLDLNYERDRFSEKLWIFIAWHLPKALIKWSAIRLIANATQGKYSDAVVTDLTAMDALKRWDEV